MARSIKFGIDEWYHCYNRGIDKRIVFDDATDARRFVELLFLANDTAPVRRDDLPSGPEIFLRDRKQVVSIVAYTLMPNHYHLILREVREGGISLFMQKLGTAYTMYYNVKNMRVGNVFTKPFRARHLKNDRYMQHAVKYVHFNPCELFEPKWKEGMIRNETLLIKKLQQYEYSSLPDFLGTERLEGNILDRKARTYIRTDNLISDIREAREYYAQAAQEGLLP